jgi:hypothetical protein
LVQTVKETGSVLHKKGAGRPVVFEDNVKSIREVSVHSPCKLTRAAAHDLQMPHSTLHRVLQKCMHLYAYKLLVVQAITPDDRIANNQFVLTMLQKLDKTANS